MTKDEIRELGWEELLRKAVTEPGLIHEAYSQFHRYSIGNKVLALWQCYTLEIQPGPLNTYKRWTEMGRQVQKGQKALFLWQPFDGKRKEIDPETGEEVVKPFRYFKLVPRWFVLSQTEGEDVEFPATSGWDFDQALKGLEISQVAFDHPDGNVQGFARPGKQISISPIAKMPVRTAVHEIAHVLHGHVDKSEMIDRPELTRSLEEAEAEGAALIVLASLGLPGEEFSRGYIQHWWSADNEIPEASARRIFSVANQILEAGRETINVTENGN